MSSRLSEVALRVRDLSRSVTFYRDVLGVPVGAGDDESSHFEAFWGTWSEAGSDLLMLIVRAADGEVHLRTCVTDPRGRAGVQKEHREGSGLPWL